MAGEAFRLYEAGGRRLEGKAALDYDYIEAGRYNILPERDEIDEAARLLLERHDRIVEQFGIKGYQALEKLVDSAIKTRKRLVPLTRRFIETLNQDIASC